MTKKENVRESLKQLRLGRVIAFEIKGLRHFAKLRDNYIRIVCFGARACRNTVNDWHDEFGKAKSFEVLSDDFCVHGL